MRAALVVLCVSVAALVAVPLTWALTRGGDGAAGSLELVVSGSPALPAPEPAPAPGFEGGADGPAPPADPPSAPGAALQEIDTRPGSIERLERRPPPRPVQLGIPSIGVDAAVIPAGLAADGTLDVPSDAATVVWYRHGSAPSEPGSTVLAAHVDWNGERGVFYRVRELEPGDRVVLGVAGGKRVVYRVVARRLYDRDELPQFVFRQRGRPFLTLITCGGGYDGSARSYLDNLVVFAVPAA